MDRTDPTGQRKKRRPTTRPKEKIEKEERAAAAGAVTADGHTVRVAIFNRCVAIFSPIRTDISNNGQADGPKIQRRNKATLDFPFAI